MNELSKTPSWTRVAFLTTLTMLSSCASLREQPDRRWLQAVASELRKDVASTETLRDTTRGSEPILFPTELSRFYRARKFGPVWLPNAEGDGDSGALMERIEKAFDHGLSPDRYHADALLDLKRKMQSAKTFPESVILGAKREALLSDAFLAYAHDMAGGVVDPNALDPNWAPARTRLDIVGTLENAIRSHRVGAVLDELTPQAREYLALQDGLKQYRALAVSGSSTAASRLNEIRIALERWRWLPRSLGERYVLVDIAAFKLTLFDKGRPVMRMPVIVGKQSEPTPVFDDQITYLVLNPSWTVPQSIVLDELLPELRKDPGYLAKKELKIFDRPGKNAREIAAEEIDWSKVEPDNWKYYLRQEASPRNPLGKIKFMFPNRFSVYIHGTPQKKHFARATRSESHGCIRVARPEELAAYLLKDNKPSLDEIAIQDAFLEEKERSIKLSPPVPVHIFYSTVGVDDRGNLEFRRDVYHWNEPTRLALEQAQPSALRVAR